MCPSFPGPWPVIARIGWYALPALERGSPGGQATWARGEASRLGVAFGVLIVFDSFPAGSCKDGLLLDSFSRGGNM